MANQLTKNVKVQLVAGAVADNLDYIRASVSKMDQASFKNKKYGRQYDLYIPGTGNVYEGLEAHPDDVVEHQTPIFLNNFNTSCKLDAFEELGGIEDFTKEIAKPKGTQLARKLQKSVVEKNVYKNMQAVVSATPSFDALSDSAAALAELATDGDLVSFMHPTVMGKISASGLANFIPSQQAAEIYSKNYLGEYGGASQIRLPVLPVLKTPASIPAASITLTPVTDDADTVIGFEAITKLSGDNLVAGIPYKVVGAKIVDQTGIETDQDVVVTPVDAQGNIMPLYITVAGKGFNSPNAWVEAGTESVTLTPMLDANTEYYVGQVRTSDALAFDTYKFANLPGSENEDVATVGGITVKMSAYGEGNVLEKLIRFDAPHASGVWEPRNCVGVYIKK